MNTQPLFVRLIFSGISVLLLGTGCAHESKTARTSTTVQTTSAVQRVPTTQAPPAVANTEPNATTSNLSVSTEIIEMCNIHFNDIDNAPKFNFDESVLVPEERRVLDQVAKCLSDGPLKGRSVELVGRADPRGEEEYNFVLGENRADAVETYLLDAGVARHQIDETSRGKLDATGTDETGWQRDRRVDILLQ